MRGILKRAAFAITRKCEFYRVHVRYRDSMFVSYGYKNLRYSFCFLQVKVRLNLFCQNARRPSFARAIELRKRNFQTELPTCYTSEKDELVAHKIWNVSIKSNTCMR